MITRQDRLIELSTKQYPLTLEGIRQSNPQVSFGSDISEKDLLSLGYAKVFQADQPTGDVVTEKAPVEHNGKWIQQWEARGFNETETTQKLKQKSDQLIQEIDKKATAELAVGAPYEYKGTTYHIQLRPEDRVNLLTVKDRAYRAEAANDETPMIFRPYENVTLEVTAKEMIDIAETALVQCEETAKVIWDLKDLVRNATTLNGFPTIPAKLFNFS